MSLLADQKLGRTLTQLRILFSTPKAEILHWKERLKSAEKKMRVICDHNYALTRELERLRNLNGDGRTLPSPHSNISKA